MNTKLWMMLLGLGVAVVPAPRYAAASLMCLSYECRYNHQTARHDHLVGVERIWDHHALISSNLDVVLVDLESLTSGGTQVFLDRLAGVDVYNTVSGSGGYTYANLRKGGFAVLHVDSTAMSISMIRQVAEPGVYFEKMCLAGNLLYVPAHAFGIRAYDVSNPANPVLVGSLVQGFDDAFSIAVEGDLAYVADGAGGLKIVNVSSPAAPLIIAGENPDTAAGTAEDVIAIGGHVYVASGGAGVAAYPAGTINGRVLYDTPVCAKQLAHVGEYLAVADIGGLEVFRVEPDGSLTHAAREAGMHRSAGAGLTLRLWHGVSSWADDRILAANWDSMDVYRIVDPALDDQPDITPSGNRLRFSPSGGQIAVRIDSMGAAALELTSIQSSASTFNVSPTSATLAPGEALNLVIDYAGGQPGSASILIYSNDPDESPLPIEVFGQTEYLDPGEDAVPFTLPSWTFDHENGIFNYATFDLQEHLGRIVYFHVFGIG